MWINNNNFLDYKKGDVIEVFRQSLLIEVKMKDNQAYSQRQLKAGENLKKILARIFIQQNCITWIDTKLITITEVRISPDFKHAKFFTFSWKEIIKFSDILNQIVRDKKNCIKRVDGKIYA